MNRTIIIHSIENSEVETREREGKQWLVSPVVAVKPGVLNGWLAPAEELSQFVDVWNDVPVPVSHPERKGQNVSSRHLEIIENEVVGRLYNVEWNDKLKGEIWVDIEKAESLAENDEEIAEALNKLREGEEMDVSTAYYSDVEQESGTFNGEEYEGIQRNIRPDHLALLPQEEGAMTFDDGVGTPIVNHQEIKTNQMQQARTPNFDGTETSPDWGDVDLTLTAFIEGYHEHSDDAPDDIDDIPRQWPDLSQEARQWMAMRSMLGDPEADDFSEGVYFPVVNPSTDNLNYNGLTAARSRAGAAVNEGDITEDQHQSLMGITATLMEDEFDREPETNTSAIQKAINLLKNTLSRGGDNKDMTDNKQQTNDRDDYDKRELAAGIAAHWEISTGEALEILNGIDPEGEGNIDRGILATLVAREYEGIDPVDVQEGLAQMEEEAMENEGDKDDEYEDNSEEKTQNQDDNDEGGQDEMSGNTKEIVKNVLEEEYDLTPEEIQELKENANEMKSQKEKERQKLVGELKENSEVDFEDEELEEMGINVLRKVKDAVSQPATNYIGKAGGNPDVNEDEEIEIGSTIKDFQ